MRERAGLTVGLAALGLSAVLGSCGDGHGAPSAAPISTTTAPVRSSPGATLPPTTVERATPSTATSTSTCGGQVNISGWTLQRRAAELVVAPVLDFDPTTMSTVFPEGAGGILFLGSAEPPATLAAEIRASTAGDVLAPLVMADEEGGGVQRLEGSVSSIPWPREMAATLTPQAVEELADEVGTQMRALGVNVDLAPVLDVDGGSGPSESDPDGARSFSSDPSTVARYGTAFLDGLEAAGVLPVVKHFPGLGGSSGNTDYEKASTPPLASLESTGLVPFRAAIGAGAPAVMVANASVPGLTAAPAALSPSVIGLLRGTLGFHGLVITDSLSAGAITQSGYDLPHAAVAAVEAGADMVTFGSTLTASDAAQLSPAAVGQSVDLIAGAVAAAARSGALPVSRLDAAVEQVLAAKHVTSCEG